jgi:hypothetical protein
MSLSILKMTALMEVPHCHAKSHSQMPELGN